LKHLRTALSVFDYSQIIPFQEVSSKTIRTQCWRRSGTEFHEIGRRRPS